MKILRWLLMVAAIAWVSVAWIHWTTEVALAPVISFRDDGKLAFRGFTATGELVLVHVRPAEPRRGQAADVGPVELWSFPQCVKARAVFQSDDIIESLP